MQINKKRVDDILIGELYPNEDMYVIAPQHEYYTAIFNTKQKCDWNSNVGLQKETISVWIDDYMKVEKELPASIYNFPNLQFLEIPDHLIKKIKWAYFKELKVLISTGAKLTFTKDDQLPNLIHLYLASGLIRFWQGNLPALKSIGCKYTDTSMEEIYAYKQMDNISFSNVNENIFNKISQLETLRKLDIHRGKLQSISGVTAIKGLEVLNLGLLPNLTDLDELENMTTLEKLTINTCKNVVNWKFLLALKSLKHLLICGNGNNHPNESIVEELRHRKIVGVY